MKSLISNYLNSRRSFKLDESNEAKEGDENKQNAIKQPETNDDCTQNSLEDSILNLNLKYIDDNDSDSASNPESNSISNVLSDSSQVDSQYKAKTCQYILESLNKLNIHIEHLLDQQYQSVVNLNNSSKVDRSYIKKQNLILEHKIPQTKSIIVDQVQTCLFYVDHFLAGDKRNSEMSQSDCLLNQNPYLLSENRLLKEKIRSLEEKLKQQCEQDTNQLKQTIESMKLERKKLKVEKVEILNRTKQLYKVIETKENQIKSILKTFESRTKETCSIVKKLIENKSEIEEEKCYLEAYIEELVAENSELKLVVESKNASLNKLQRQLYDLKSKSPRYSIGKESDHGYSSSKSRDTLSSSLIDTNVASNPKVESKINKSNSKYKTKKEERSQKCKSNDSYLYIKNNQLTEASFSLPHSANSRSTKIKNKFRLNKLSTSASYHHNIDNTKSAPTSKSNNNLSFIMSSSDYEETDLNKVLDSDEFIDLDENDKNSAKSDKKDNLIVSTTSASSSSSASFTTNSSLKHLELSSSTTMASVSPSISLTSSSTSSYKNDPTDSKNDLNKPLALNISAESETSSSDLSPLVMSQSITLCEEDNLNKTLNDFSNTSRYSVKQPLSMSMNVQTPNSNVKSRSSRLINTIIRMSTIGSSISNPSNRSSALVETKQLPTSYSTTLSSKTKNRHSHYSTFVSSKSSYCVRDTEDDDCETKNLLDKSFKILEEEHHNLIISDWSQQDIKNWLEKLGLPSIYVKNGLRHLTSGKMLINLNETDLEKLFQMANIMHKRKLKLALDELRYPDKCKHTKLGEITNEWLVNKWLKDIGLVYLQGIFRLNLVDGRVLASLHKKDLEKYFGVTRKIHQNSLLLAIELLRKHDFDVHKINGQRELSHKENQTLDICLWTNENFIDWLKLVNLHEHVDKLPESGMHGALVADSSFNTECLFHCLQVQDESKYANIRKILDDEIKLLKKTKNNMKMDSAFSRPLSSFRNDKQRIFTFRGSLGRALGKKVKRDISSPLIDDETLKKIEFSHKIIDMKSSTNNSLA
ncbi:kazrin-like isoform X4 [Brachionus plicatilis]|uniref:Kazrin-like isoform X4 n=1 Tax=Brachionus plicatilis TaxID=10195 RepID=A0A3M7PXF9_BRAPC|nr:kazrin-like isoform X4 [Brachionus plicatilis]